MKWSLRAYKHIYPIDIEIIVDNHSRTALDSYQPPIIREALTSLLRNILNTDFNIKFCVVINRAFESSPTSPYENTEPPWI